MASHARQARPPVVVVTGMGVVTSLGAGKADNWAKLTAGKSGIQRITPLSDRRSEDHDRRHGRFRAGRAVLLAPSSSRAAGRHGGRGSDRANPASARAAISPARCSSPCRRSRSNGRSAAQLAAASGANDSVGYDDLLRARRRRQFHAIHERFLFGSVADHLADQFGTKGSPISLSTACASGATAIQLGVEAIRRGETDAALCIGTDGSVNPESLIRFSLLSALSTSNDPPQAAAKPFSKNRDGFVMAEGAGALVLESLRIARRRAAPRSSASSKAAARWPTASTAPARARTASRSSAASATRSPTPASTPDDIDYVNPHGTGTPENDKMECVGVHGRVRRARQDDPDLVQQVDDRPHAVGGRRGRGGVLAADAASTSASRRPSTTTCPIRRFRSTWCRTWRATPRCATRSRTRSASADRTSRW